MSRFRRSVTRAMTASVLVVLVIATSLSFVAKPAEAATAPPALNLNVLLIGTGSTDPTTAAWESALTSEGVAYTEATATGTYGAETVTLPTLTDGTTGNFNGVVIADSPAAFASGQLTALFSYESTYGIRQLDGYTAPYTGIGENNSSTTAVLDGTNGSLTAAGLAGLPGLAGTVPFAAGTSTAPATSGYPATVATGAPFTPWLDSSTGAVLAGVYQHPTTDPQSGVSELALNFDYSSTMIQWLLLAPGLINWVTSDTHLGLDRNYVEMDIDDTFTPDNAWSTAVHDNDYSDADSLRMQPADVTYAAQWSKANDFRMDQLFNYGGTDEYQAGELDLPGDTAGPDPLLAAFQATDPTTGKPYADDFGWLSHTYDTPYLDVGCASQNYIEAELNQNTSEAAAAPSTTPGEGGLGLTESTDTSDALGTENPQVFVPGNHSGFADLDPGTPSTVDPPDLDEADASTTGGTLAAGTYEYAVTDQFNSADSTSTDQSQAYVTDGLQGDVAPVVVTGSTGSVSLVWQAICHADNYIVYRAPVTDGVVGSWSQIGTLATPSSATLPDNSSGDPTSTTNVTNGGELELTYTDTGAAGTAEPAGWTPPTVENAQETPWEQNPYFIPALEAVGITTVGADASKAYPNPPTATFGTGDISGGTNTSYTGATYAAGVPFVDGTSEVAPRHPINIFYNASTEAQEVDEYNTLYDADAPDSQCKSTSVTTCSTTPSTFADVVNQVVSGMLQNMLSNNPEPSYVHQTNLMGQPPAGAATTGTPPATPDTTGDGLLYSVLNPLLADYHTYYTSATPYEQPTLGAIGTVLADQTNWSSTVSAGSVKATEQNGVVTVTNSGTGSVNVPVTAPAGTTVGGAAYGESYAGQLSTWTSVAAGGTLVLDENGAPAITSAATASSIVGAAFSATVTTTGEPAPAITETGTLPSGISFLDNANGTATISGTPATGSGGSYPITITATNASGTSTQAFTLTNSEAPTITSPAATTFYAGSASTYTVTTTGYPASTITETGTLPAGLTFTVPSPATGSATIAGTTTAAAGTYPVTIQATNSSGSTATLDLVITTAPSGPPVFTSPTIQDFPVNQPGTIAVTATGGPPVSAITETGALPSGLSWSSPAPAAGANAEALIAGTPTETGTFGLVVTATNTINGTVTTTTQDLSIVVSGPPAITSATSATATVGKAFSFTVTTTGYPTPSLGWSGTLPPGLSFTDNGDGTATISGTPTGASSADLAWEATNASGETTQPFALTIVSPPPPSTPPPTTSQTPAPGSTTLAGGGRLAATPDGLGYWVVGSNGSVASYGTAANYGSMAGKHLNQPIVGIAATPDGKGYWLVATDGGIFTFGDAHFYGSTGAIKLNKPIVGITSTLDGKGYWMVASDGGVFSFGDARFHGSTGSIRLNKPVVGMSPTPSGNGYWLVASDGGIFTFGDAVFHGSTGAIKLNQPITGMAPTRDGHGYWLVASDGGIFTFGDATFHGSGGSSGNPAVGMIVSPTRAGYSLIDANGVRVNFGF
jgi:hypothetical protein